MALWWILLTVLLLLTYFFFSRKFRYWSDRGVPGPVPFTPLGNFLDYLRHGQAQMERQWLAKYGKVYGWYKGPLPSLSIADPALVKQVLVKDFGLFVNRSLGIKVENEYWTNNLLNAEDEQWKRIRAITSPSFTSGKLKKMHGLMERCVDKLTAYMDKVVTAKDGHMNAKEIITGFTIDIISCTNFATETNANEDRGKANAFVENGSRVFEIQLWRVAAAFLLPLQLNKWIGNELSFFIPKVFYFFVNLSREIIRQRKSEAETETAGLRNDLVQLMMDAFVYEKDLSKTDYEQLTATMENDVTEDHEHGSSNQTGVKRTLTETEIISQCFFFFVAGFDTTSNAITNCLYNMALNPSLQERLYQEVSQAVESLDGGDGDAYFDVVNSSIPYLDAFIKETLRMAPPVPRMGRVLSVDGYKLGGIPLEKGQDVDIAVYASHYCPDHFPRPETFDPERFMPENKEQIQPYTYMPFGAGPRNCIGMRFAYQEIRLCLVKLVRRYRFERTPTTPVPLDFAKVGLLTTKNVPLRIVRR